MAPWTASTRTSGTIDAAEQEMLRTIGGWLTVNGEAIYGTRPWRVAAEGPTEQRSGYFTDGSATAYTAQDLRFTHRSGTEGEFVYATALDWPTDAALTVTSLPNDAAESISSVTLLGHRCELAWTQDAEGLHVTLPTTAPSAFEASVRIHLSPSEPTPRMVGFHSP